MSKWSSPHLLEQRRTERSTGVVSRVSCPTSSDRRLRELIQPTAPATPLGTRMPSVLPLALENASRIPAALPPCITQLGIRARFQGGEEPGTFRQQRAERGADRRGAVLDRPRSASMEPQPPAPGRRPRPDRDSRPRGMSAMAHVAGGDAMIGCFDAKYHYLSWRPIHAIPRDRLDGDSHTVPDSSVGSPCCRRRIIRSIHQLTPVTRRPSPRHSRASLAQVASTSRSTAS